MHMKGTLKLLLTFALLAAAMLTPSADVKAQRYFDLISPASDTLVNQDTIIYTTTPVLIDVPYYYSIYVAADSLSGANAGTAYLQFCNDRTGTNWYNAETLTIDGTSRSAALWQGILYARRVRIYFITPSGTRRVWPIVNASFKRLN